MVKVENRICKINHLIAQNLYNLVFRGISIIRLTATTLSLLVITFVKFVKMDFCFNLPKVKGLEEALTFTALVYNRTRINLQ